MFCNQAELLRKYEKVHFGESKIVIELDKDKWGNNIQETDGIITMKPDFLARVYGDVLHALNIEPGTKEAMNLKNRYIITKDERILLEYLYVKPVQARSADYTDEKTNLSDYYYLLGMKAMLQKLMNGRTVHKAANYISIINMLLEVYKKEGNFRGMEGKMHDIKKKFETFIHEESR